MANKQIDMLYNERAITSLITTILIPVKDQHIHSGLTILKPVLACVVKQKENDRCHRLLYL